MTSARFLWVVVAGKGHSSEPRGLTEDLGDAKAKVNGIPTASSQGPDRLVRRRLGPDGRPSSRSPEAPNDPRVGARVLRRRARLSATFAELLIDCEEDRTRGRSSGCCERPAVSVRRPTSPTKRGNTSMP